MNFVKYYWRGHGWIGAGSLPKLKTTIVKKQLFDKFTYIPRLPYPAWGILYYAHRLTAKEERENNLMIDPDSRMEHEKMDYVYKYELAGQVLYVGKSKTKGFERLKQHGRPGDNIPEHAWENINNADIYYIETANSTMSDVLESELINKLKPLYNKAKTSDWAGLDLNVPEWKPYRIKGNIASCPRNEVEKELKERIADEQAITIHDLLSENRILTAHLARFSKRVLISTTVGNQSKLYLWDPDAAENAYEELTEDSKAHIYLNHI